MNKERNFGSFTTTELLEERSMHISLTQGLYSDKEKEDDKLRMFPRRIVRMSKRCHQKHLRGIEEALSRKRQP